MFVSLLMVLNIGTIRKNEDPILKTQTDPISYKQKLEETKDGVKGAPTPSFSYYKKEAFLVKSPMGEEKIQEAAASKKTVEVSEVDLKEETPEQEEPVVEETPSKEEEDEEWWVEEETDSEESPEESPKPTDVEG